ncbi:dynein light chain Tctex-type 1-like [Stigmatopora argus]
MRILRSCWETGDKCHQMEEYNNGDEVVFNPDEATNNIKECIEGVIGGMDYSQSKVNQWSAAIVEQSLAHLVKQRHPFKYIVNCTVMQKSGAGLHTANSCYWDNGTDGSCTVRWENRTMYCVVCVFAVAL